MRLLAVGTLFVAVSAANLSAQTTWTSSQANPGDPGVGAGESVVVNFEAPVAGVTYSGSYTIGTGLVSGFRAPPFGDLTNYFATPGVLESSTGSATIDFTTYLASLGYVRTVSFYWGSIDTYNTLEVLGLGGSTLLTLNGTDVNNPANGDQSAPATNQRLFLTFDGPDQFTGLRLTSNGRAFEIDDIALSFAEPNIVPEPAAWTMLAFGLSLLGFAAVRRQRGAGSLR